MECIITGRYLLRCLSDVQEGDSLPAGVDIDSTGAYRVEGEPIDQTAIYLAWNCASQARVFIPDWRMSDWSVGRSYPSPKVITGRHFIQFDWTVAPG